MAQQTLYSCSPAKQTIADLHLGAPQRHSPTYNSLAATSTGPVHEGRKPSGKTGTTIATKRTVSSSDKRVAGQFKNATPYSHTETFDFTNAAGTHARRMREQPVSFVHRRDSERSVWTVSLRANAWYRLKRLDGCPEDPMGLGWI